MTEKSKLKILDAGSGTNESIKVQQFEDDYDVDVFRVDINPDNKPDLVHDLREPLPEDMHESFDMVILNHVLEHIPRMEIVVVLENMRDCLRDEGEIHVAVPSMEWAAELILGDNPLSIPVIYGNQTSEWELHRCGFTLAWLRELIQSISMIPRRANQGFFQLSIDDVEYRGIENIIVAVRHKDFEANVDNPASALE